MINLLPPEIKQKEKLASKVYAVISLYTVAASLIALACAGVWTYRFILENSLLDKQGQLASLETASKTNAELLDRAAFIKSRLTNQANYQDEIDWAELLGKLASYTPTSIQLTDLSINSSTASATLGLNGLANSRRDIILFKDKLNSSKEFTQAEITALSDRDKTGSQPFSFTIQAAIKEKSK